MRLLSGKIAPLGKIECGESTIVTSQNYVSMSFEEKR
jgi:hypothetical protein